MLKYTGDPRKRVIIWLTGVTVYFSMSKGNNMKVLIGSKASNKNCLRKGLTEHSKTAIIQSNKPWSLRSSDIYTLETFGERKNYANS